jgi:hypothetical protein
MHEAVKSSMEYLQEQQGTTNHTKTYAQIGVVYSGGAQVADLTIVDLEAFLAEL